MFRTLMRGNSFISCKKTNKQILMNLLRTNNMYTQATQGVYSKPEVKSRFLDRKRNENWFKE